MKKLLIAVVTALALVASTATMSPAAAAENYVTKKEFRKVKKNWSKPRVHNVFDVNGKQTWYISGSEYCSLEDLWACATQSREYRTKRKYGSVTVDYVRYPNGTWRVDSKYAYWG